MAQTVKNLVAIWEIQVGSLGWEDTLEKGIATHSIQYSCLENSMDRGDWQAMVHGVTNSRTWLSIRAHTAPWVFTLFHQRFAQGVSLTDQCCNEIRGPGHTRGPCRLSLVHSPRLKRLISILLSRAQDEGSVLKGSSLVSAHRHTYVYMPPLHGKELLLNIKC